MELTPKEIVAELDKHIVGQHDAKRSVAVAVRNRWRRQRVEESMRKEISPKNIMMIGPTGVGKTEIARRLATLTGAPFIKVEATKYTEVGYYGRDVESMIRELVENALGIIRSAEREKVRQDAKQRAEDRLVDMLLSPSKETELNNDDNKEQPDGNSENVSDDQLVASLKHQRNREKIREMLREGLMEDKTVVFVTKTKAVPMVMSNMPGMDSMEIDLQETFEMIAPVNKTKRVMTVKEARDFIIEQECDALINKEKTQAAAVELAENLGIIFIDEIDKIVAGDKQHGADVSRQGVQRDLLPIVEGTTVQTKYGYVKTDHILFIAAGAFHRSKPSELMPELQGRFPIRVELTGLNKEDFVRILTEPDGSLTKQYQALMKTEDVELVFEYDGIDMLAEYAFKVNQRTQNIGARRLYTIMERLLEELSFNAPDSPKSKVVVDAGYVCSKIEDVCKDEDLSKYIL
ncbi:ATP-dependent protease ATPase subunit HslU [Planctomycetales bacterium]|nr:ATP-dependent protease ATPase subunit HslU [Planctomycetales bacterium]GHT36067.1 ATP-dependent protease ATPase subunit HslU [Planctomycetales bacterium]